MAVHAERLLGKVAIITGAAAGIGRGTAELFAEHGAKLVLVDRDEVGLNEVVATFRANGVECLQCVADVKDRAAVERVVTQTGETFGGVDIVFNNAGIMPLADIQDLSEETWDEVLDTNLKAMFLMCKAAIPVMLRRGSGSIINTSSIMATLTEPGYTAYTTSKAGIIGLTKEIAVSYAERGIRCNAICPGWVDTPMNQRLAEELGGLDKLYPLIKKQQPQGRMASVREVGYAVLFLASDEASAVTGSCLYVDGGASASI